MQAVQINAPGEARIVKVEKPTPGPSEAPAKANRSFEKQVANSDDT